MTDRTSLIDGFLAATPWASSSRAPLAGDASLRKYQRVSPNSRGVPAVLMDADPALGNDVLPFMQITEYLRDIGLSAPEIYHSDTSAGLLLIEDLGDDLFARVLERDPQLETTLYTSAVQVLLALHDATPPDLTPYDTSVMTQMAALSFDWYQRGALGVVNTEAKILFTSLFSALLDTEVAPPSVLIQRDYHAENLLWMPDRIGTARVGLLDYQDAQLGHPAYDLVSLLKDARRDVGIATEAEMISLYCAQSGQDAQTFRRAYHVLGLQRNLRILGVFARLSLHYGKPHYVDLIPRVWGFIERDLAEPVNAPVADLLRAALPAPTPEILQGLKDKCATLPAL